MLYSFVNATKSFKKAIDCDAPKVGDLFYKIYMFSAIQ